MTTREIDAVLLRYRSRVEALLTADELARFDAFQRRVEAAIARRDLAPTTPTADQQLVLDKLAEDTEAAALRKQLDVLLRIETLPQ
jgi:hypothetical protein